MKKLTSSQVVERFEWLYQVKNREITATQEQIKLLESTKAFCALEIPGKFKPIAYNSLKKYCSTISLPIHLLGQGAAWDHILRLREDAYRSTIDYQTDCETVNTDQLLEEMSRHMHRYETAYFSLFREIRAIAESDRNLPDLSRKRLVQALSQSKALQMTTFANPVRYEESTSLKIIDGGKS
ncbi:hypothetical protein [Pseudomonas alvandae]|uniref:Uncharacterized protein n=1 Tax=Pseudomonas canavaninivorans TaxID=2842348 RepID=A0ABX8QG58_PSECO|nr:hypothetical protein [Pseudomonas alvandae]QXI54248.1 hypothetical protein KSS97_04650 [Pseudomonas alvandae]